MLYVVRNFIGSLDCFFLLLIFNRKYLGVGLFQRTRYFRVLRGLFDTVFFVYSFTFRFISMTSWGCVFSASLLLLCILFSCEIIIIIVDLF